MEPPVSVDGGAERSGSISPTCSTLREFQRQADRQAIDLIADDQRASGVTSYRGRIGGNPARPGVTPHYPRKPARSHRPRREAGAF